MNEPLETHAVSAEPSTGRSPWRSVKLWLALLVACTVVGLVEGTQYYLSTIQIRTDFRWVDGLASAMPSWYVLGLLFPATFWMAHRFPFEEGRWRWSVPAHLVAAVIFAFVHLGASTVISDEITAMILPADAAPLVHPGFVARLSELLGIYFVTEIFFYSMFVGLAHALDYRRWYRERERQAAQLALKASRLEGSLMRANLESLRMQLNPHFLFNTLNAISVMAMKGEKHGVVRTLTLLSDLLRVSLENKAQVVPLRDEIAFLERYLEIEQIRFKDRLTVRFDLAPETLDAEVPTLALQPLVENAIRHGISRKTGPGEIVVRSLVRGGDTLVLEVTDTGPGFGAKLETARTGIGMANTRARLEQLYGTEQTLEHEDATGGGAIVRMRLPYHVCMEDVATTPNAVEPRTA